MSPHRQTNIRDARGGLFVRCGPCNWDGHARSSDDAARLFKRHASVLPSLFDGQRV